MERLETLKKIVGSKELILSREQYSELKKFNDDFVSKQKVDEQLKKDIGEEKYNNLCTLAEDYNKKCDAIKWVSSLEEFEANDLITNVFSCFIFAFNGYDIVKLFKRFKNDDKKLSHSFEIADILRDCYEYCIENNFDGSCVSATLKDCFGASKLVINQIVNLFNKNRMQLQVNYICKCMKEKEGN